MFFCQVADHYSAGMFTFYNAKECSNREEDKRVDLDGKLRRYYIAAEEVEWDYGPTGMNKFDGGRLNETDR